MNIDGLEHKRAKWGKFSKWFLRISEAMAVRFADVIVVDPPRKGCDTAALETIVKMKPERIVYVSCDSATLARDVKWLGERGYEVKKVKACDMFPGTVHVETVCLLNRVK